MAEIGENFLSLNQRNLGESILNIITHLTNMSNARRFRQPRGSYDATNKGGLSIYNV